MCDSSDSDGGDGSHTDDRQLLARKGIGNQKCVYARQRLNDRNGFGRSIWIARARPQEDDESGGVVVMVCQEENGKPR